MGSRPTEVGYTKNDPEDHDQVKAGRNNMTTQRVRTPRSRYAVANES